MSSSVINFLSKNQNRQTFDSSGSFTIPEGITTIRVLGAGGGGGGAGGNGGGTLAGGGGAGAVPQLVTINVTPGDVWTVTIGNGGGNGSVNSDGGNGSNSSFRRSGIGPVFSGAEGGKIVGMSGTSDGGKSLVSQITDLDALSTGNDFAPWNASTHFTYGGRGDDNNGGTGQSGQSSPYGTGGTGGTGSDRGGGGGAGFGNGGNGSSTTSGTATSGGISAGGGGGGGAKAGGNGGAGRIIVFW